MMDLIKEQTRQYLFLIDLKSSIKDEECREKRLKSELEKIQREEKSDSLDTVMWKIKRAEFILACEKKRRDLFYKIMEAAEDAISKDCLFQEYKKYGSDINSYKAQLETEKSLLIKQLEELKQ